MVGALAASLREPFQPDHAAALERAGDLDGTVGGPVVDQVDLDAAPSQPSKHRLEHVRFVERVDYRDHAIACRCPTARWARMSSQHRQHGALLEIGGVVDGQPQELDVEPAPNEHRLELVDVPLADVMRVARRAGVARTAYQVAFG